MSTFPFFPNRKKLIARLVEQSRLLTDAESKQTFAEQVREVFEPLIERRLPKAEQADDFLQRTILFELCGLIGTLPVPNIYFVDHHEQTLDELINACRWKVEIKSIRFNKLTQGDKPAQLNELVQKSVSRQKDVQQWIVRIRQRPQMDRHKRLSGILTESDSRAVAYRTVRAFLNCLLDGKRKIDAEFIFWLRDGRVELRPDLAQEYLFDQIALRVYLFHSTHEADFIEEALGIVKQWIIAEVAQQAGKITSELEHGIKDIVSGVKMDFINKCQRKKDEPETLWLDVKLTTYLFSFVKRKHAIDKLLNGQRGDEPTNEATANDPNLSANGTIDDLDVESIREYESSRNDYIEELKSRLHRCLTKLGDDCKELILRHFNNDFGDTVPFLTLAFEYKMSQKTLESRFNVCMEKLKKMVNGLS